MKKHNSLMRNSGFQTEIATNTKVRGIKWDLTKVPTVADYEKTYDGTEKYFLNVGSFCIADGKKVYPIPLRQEKINKTHILFKTKIERTNFIKNISKIVALQYLFGSIMFGRSPGRLMPPIDREYTKEELLDYFHFPKEDFYKFDDIEKEESDSHYISYERWRDWRKEKYGLDWDEE